MITAAILLIPLFCIRYVLPAVLSKDALRRAAHFPPMAGFERIAYWVYQIATATLIVYVFFLKIRLTTPWFYMGLAVYISGVLLLVVSCIHFARPMESGLNTEGVYRFSRNPMYVAYFLYFLGCCMLTGSYVLLAVLLVFQLSAHWIILAEERWCGEVFGEAYGQYKKDVRRYL